MSDHPKLVRPHIGLAANRLKPNAGNPREVAFAEQWSLENDHHKRRHVLGWLIGEHFTERDAQVAATVIQWLGSNVGMSFLEEVALRSPEVHAFLRARLSTPASVPAEPESPQSNQ